MGGSCQSDNNCAANQAYPYCDSTAGVCVECLDTSATNPCGQGGACVNDVCYFGCDQLLTCISDCNGSASCQQDCYTLTSPDGQQTFQALLGCIVTYCPDTGGGICDSSAANYNASNCNLCIEEVQEDPCYCYEYVLICNDS
jgi:hypothetical protein